MRQKFGDWLFALGLFLGVCYFIVVTYAKAGMTKMSDFVMRGLGKD